MKNKIKNPDFAIFSIGWITEKIIKPDPGSEWRNARRKRALDLYWSYLDFLQSNSLTKQVLIKSKEDMTDDFTLRSTDLTAEGLEFVRSTHDNWCDFVDKAGQWQNRSILEKALNKIRPA